VTDGYKMNIKTDIGEIIRGITKLNNSSYIDVRISFNKRSIFQDKFFNQVWLPIGVQFERQISVLNHMNVCPSIGPVSIN
jgi:predicted transcriptional regulator